MKDNKQGAHISTTLNNVLCIIAAMASGAISVLLSGSGYVILGLLFLIPFIFATLRLRIHYHDDTKKYK